LTWGDFITLKEVYQKRIESQLSQLRGKVDELSQQATQAEAYLQIEYHQWVSHLRFKQERAQLRYEELKNSGERSWEDFQDGVEHSLTDLKNSVDQTMLRFSYP